MYKYLIKCKTGKEVYIQEKTPQEALFKYLSDCNYSVKKICKLLNANDYDFYVKRKGGADNYYRVVLQKKVEKEEKPMSIVFDGKPYECKRYTYEELHKILCDKVVILKDSHVDHSDLIDGILVGICNPEDEDSVAVQNMKDGKDYSYWYIGPSEIVTPYLGV